eukprot:NODE_46_length_32145_cov_0.918711.p21 type:complete len:209 gc:universal NODE_46_length_32145_cov_0.918711:365-991(+)
MQPKNFDFNDLIIRSAKISLTRWGTDKYFRLYDYIINYLVLQYPKSNLVLSLGKLLPAINDARYLMRFGGIPETLYYNLYSADWKDYLQNYLMLLYYPLEHVYWLSVKKVLNMSDSKTAFCGIWMCRVWLAYIVVDLYRNYISYKKGPLDKHNKADIYRNIGDFIMCAHWSSYRGLITDKNCRLAGILSSVAGIYQHWIKYAPTKSQK